MKHLSLSFEATPEFIEDALQYLDGDETELIRLEDFMLANPEKGDLIKGAGGARKMRYEHARKGKGKRGGLRIIYFWFSNCLTVVAIDIYSKDEKEDLTAADVKMLKKSSQIIRTQMKEELS